MIKDDAKTINAWASYDWANSVYNLIVTSAIFPVYYSNVTKEAFGGEMVNFAGWQVQNSVLFTYAISISFLVIVLLSPILSGIADYLGAKKRFMQFFTYLGSLSCIGLYWFVGENVEYGIMCSILASVGYAGSLVFYNGFLPEITYPAKMDSVSARGFTFGYIGSVILLIVNLALLLMPDTFGFEGAGEATRFGFLLVGLWWMGFAQIAFYYLKDTPTGNQLDKQSLGRGIGELKKIAAKVNARPVMKTFLLSFFFYSMGVLTVMLLAPLFAEKEVNIGAQEMIVVILILQVLAIIGAYFFSWVSSIKGSKFAIGTILVIWMGICISCYFLNIKIGFYIIAGILGFGMGGVQSISRSTYARLIPLTATDTASYFSFFDITEKLAIVIGTFAYGLIDQLTGNMRNSMLFMTLFFIIGFIILIRIQLQAEMDKIAAGEVH